MVRANLFRTLTALTLTAAAVLAALLMISATALGQEQCGGCGEEGVVPLIWGDSISPGDGEMGVPLDANVEVWFSWSLDPTSVNTDTFTLVKQDTTTPVEASVAYRDIDYSGYATLDPQADLDASTTYSATVKGGENGVKDPSGAPAMTEDYSWSFTTGNSTASPADTTLPETTIDSGPPDTVYSSSASFSFSSSESGSTFQCRLDGAPFSDCFSPKEYTGLSEGEHTFSVRATDPAGNTDPTPASRTWTVSTYSQTKRTGKAPKGG